MPEVCSVFGHSAAPAKMAATGVGKMAVLPPAFLQWLKENDVDPAVYATAHELKRYIRCAAVPVRAVSPAGGCRVAATATLTPAELEAQLGCAAEPVPWLPSFYALPPSVGLSGIELYKYVCPV